MSSTVSSSVTRLLSFPPAHAKGERVRRLCPAAMRPRPSASWISSVVVPSTVQHILDVRGIVQLLRLAALFVVLWFERIIFLTASLRCSPWAQIGIGNGVHASGAGAAARPPSSSSSSSSSSSLVISVLADPQLIDINSYAYIEHLPWPLSRFVYYIIRWAADTYARKSYQAAVRSRGRSGSDAVIWLGDLLDRGRAALASASDVEHYEQDTHRFQGLFAEKLPTIYMPGNHDIRIPLTHNAVFEQESHDSRERWIQEWGTWHDAYGRPAWSRNGGREHLLVRPQGGPSVVKVSDDAGFGPNGGGSMRPSAGNAAREALRRSVNARIPLFLNDTAVEPTHELIFVDALELAGMFPATVAPGSSFDWHAEARARFPETLDFVESLSRAATPDTSFSTLPRSEPTRLLFSHIPLFRPAGSHCNKLSATHGVLRESYGAIEQGVDLYASYQNTIAQPVTDWLLDRVAPKLIFSGDDHDHCEVTHALPGTSRSDATELTVKAFGITGGVRHPGFARVGLAWDSQMQHPRAEATPCLLPDQIAIWTHIYPLALLCIALLLAVDRRWRIAARFDGIYRDVTVAWRLALASRLGDSLLDDGLRDDEDEEWHLVEQGERYRSTDDEAEQASDDGASIPSRSFGDGLSPSQASMSPASAKRIRFGRSQVQLSPSAARRTGGATRRTPTTFEARASRELRLAAATGKSVSLQHGPLREMAKIMSWPLLLWLWFQIF